MTSIALFLITAALAAALLAAIQQARELRRLREELDTIGATRLEGLSVDQGAPGTQAPRMFSGLYATKEESPVVGLGRLPGVPVVTLAVVLGLAGSALTVAAASRASVAAPVAEAVRPAPAPDSAGALRAERDSLARLVALLQDSVRLGSTAEAVRPPRIRRRASVGVQPPTPAALPPAPKLVDVPPVVP